MINISIQIFIINLVKIMDKNHDFFMFLILFIFYQTLKKIQFLRRAAALRCNGGSSTKWRKQQNLHSFCVKTFFLFLLKIQYSGKLAETLFSETFSKICLEVPSARKSVKKSVQESIGISVRKSVRKSVQESIWKSVQISVLKFVLKSVHISIPQSALKSVHVMCRVQCRAVHHQPRVCSVEQSITSLECVV